MKVILVGALGTFPKGLIKGLEDLETKKDKWRPSKVHHY